MGASDNYTSLFIFFLLTLASEILGTLSGFGSSMFNVSILQFLFSFQVVLVISSLLHVFSNTFKIILFRKTINWKIVWWVGVSSIVFSILGAALIQFVNLEYIKLMLGFFMIAVSVFFWLDSVFKLIPSLQNSLIAGSAAGFLAGFIGTGGAIRGLLLTAFNLEKNFYVGTSSAIDFGVDVSRASIYLYNHYFTSSLFIYIPAMAVAAFLGTFIGKQILSRINQETFRKIILVMILLTGVVMVFQNWPF